MPAEPVLIGLGSNLGDRLSWLRIARRRLAAVPSSAVLAASAVFETEPVGGPPQGPYLNACVSLETSLTPHALLEALLAIEASAGRIRSAPNVPRTLDLDILLFGERVIADDHLTVPHPRFARRAFVLIPAAEIAPSWRVPPAGDAVAMLAARAITSVVRFVCGEEGWR